MAQAARKSKGTVSVESFQGRLRLRLPREVFNGQQKRMSLGLDDTPGNRLIAEAKAKDIEKDIVYERFDRTLNKYRPEHMRIVELKEELKVLPKLDELWKQFLEYKQPQCSPSTMANQYRSYTNYLKALPTHDLSQSVAIRDYCVANIPVESCKRFIVRLSACCKWAIQAGLIDSNPFEGMAPQIKVPKEQKNSDMGDINPFSTEERDRILEAFRNSLCCSKFSRIKHSHYYPYMFFSFNTGCRPSELVALQWKDISADFHFVNFTKAVVLSTSGRVKKEGLKTQDRRRFPCNEKMRNFLRSIKPENCDPESLVFPSPESETWINTNNFAKRIWRAVLEELEIEYRKPYQTRHTFITLALENGLDAKDVARLVGNSPEIIYKHYAGNKRELFVPEF